MSFRFDLPFNARRSQVIFITERTESLECIQCNNSHRRIYRMDFRNLLPMAVVCRRNRPDQNSEHLFTKSSTTRKCPIRSTVHRPQISSNVHYRDDRISRMYPAQQFASTNLSNALPKPASDGSGVSSVIDAERENEKLIN
ncbi:hypothetical protein CDAR_601291 [Caerostris darwini]|uniref:Uncharacterized protein n=1 Tax=Caerostris darwini TaxID=1538125 RepID=A0AAV4WVV2_9ARAC|nr:hypothetical protein CDAR_601291 [Caerostris darwini]